METTAVCAFCGKTFATTPVMIKRAAKLGQRMFCCRSHKRWPSLPDPRPCIKCGDTKSATDFMSTWGRVCYECYKSRRREAIKKRRLTSERCRNYYHQYFVRYRQTNARREYMRAYLKRYYVLNEERLRRYRQDRPSCTRDHVMSLDATDYNGSELVNIGMEFDPGRIVEERESKKEMRAKLLAFRNANPEEFARICRELDIEDIFADALM